MDPTAIREAARYFPLLGRPRPTCGPLIERVAEIASIAATAVDASADAGHGQVVDRMAEAAHALNKAALVASECGLPDLARQWCWRHIDLYRQLNSLTALQASYLLEPTLNLARLQIRARDSEPAIRLLKAMYEAVTTSTHLNLDGLAFPLAGLIGTRHELRQLHRWIWLQYLSEGIRILALSSRWDDAVAHATALNGIGLHLMEGRQAAIIAHCLRERGADARNLLDDSDLSQPWEQQVAACLAVMCADPKEADILVNVMIERFLAHEPFPGYAVFHTRLGLTAAVLTSSAHPSASQHVLRQTANEALTARDGYAARDILRSHISHQLDESLRAELTQVVVTAGLGARDLPGPMLASLTHSVDVAAGTLASAIELSSHAPT